MDFGYVTMKVAVLCVGALILIGLISPSIQIDSSTSDVVIQLETSQIGPIVIDSDSDFSDHGFPGTGTQDDPYRIEYYEITSDIFCITVVNVSVHYVISECILSITAASVYGAVYLAGRGYGTVRSCAIGGSGTGIVVDRSSDPKYIVDCVFEESLSRQLEVRDSSSVYLDQCHLVLADSNHGIWISNSNETHIENSYFEIYQGTSIRFEETSGVNIKNCTFDGHNESSWIFDDLGGREFVIQDSVFNFVQIHLGTQYDIVTDITIQGCVLKGQDIRIGNFSSGDVLIQNNTISHSYHGIGTEGSAQTVVTKNNITSCEVGLVVLSDNALIDNNTVFRCGTGIWVDGDKNIISRNSISFCTRWGIDVYGDSNEIYYNSFQSNEDDAEDYGTGNIFDDGVSLGNYWDTPSEGGVHPIDGTSGAIDRYPVYVNPSSLHEEDILLIGILAAIGLIGLVLVSLRKRRT